MVGKFNFAVVDLDRSKSYPQNFVCVLPLRVTGFDNAFGAVFGEKSVEQAELLLRASLKTEDDSDVRTEIKRRLKLFEEKSVSCVDCARLFKPQARRGFRQRLCERCLKERSKGSIPLAVVAAK